MRFVKNLCQAIWGTFFVVSFIGALFVALLIGSMTITYDLFHWPIVVCAIFSALSAISIEAGLFLTLGEMYGAEISDFGRHYLWLPI